MDLLFNRLESVLDICLFVCILSKWWVLFTALFSIGFVIVLEFDQGKESSLIHVCA